MRAMRGYYSVVQYCPDASRAEAASIGVALFCPEARFADAKLETSNARVKKFFGKDAFDSFALDAMKESLRERLLRERQNFKSSEDFTHFVETRANELRLTAPRPMKVDDPDRELEALYIELIGASRKPYLPRPPLVPQLDEFFRTPRLSGRVQLNLKRRVPVADVDLEVPYAYQNGALNLVKPERFVSVGPALKLACEGDMLRRHSADRLIVVPVIVNAAKESELRAHVGRVFEEYKIRVIHPDGLSNFMAEVEREAHPA